MRHVDQVQYRLPRLAALRYVREYVLWLRFSDGVEGEVDLSDGLTGEMFEPLRSAAEFSRARIEDGHLAWPNGADWAPEDLRARLGARYESVAHSIADAQSEVSAHISDVPEISRFYGIIIRMLANEHAPPHFRARYDDVEVSVSIRDGVVSGQFPARARRLVLEWCDRHKDELLANWERLRAGKPPRPVPPLD
jgi:hypothetical protein